MNYKYPTKLKTSLKVVINKMFIHDSTALDNSEECIQIPDQIIALQIAPRLVDINLKGL